MGPQIQSVPPLTRFIARLQRLTGKSAVEESVSIDKAKRRHLQAAALDGSAGVQLLVLALREAGILACATPASCVSSHQFTIVNGSCRRTLA